MKKLVVGRGKIRGSGGVLSMSSNNAGNRLEQEMRIRQRLERIRARINSRGDGGGHDTN